MMQRTIISKDVAHGNGI